MQLSTNNDKKTQNNIVSSAIAKKYIYIYFHKPKITFATLI